MLQSVLLKYAVQVRYQFCNGAVHVAHRFAFHSKRVSSLPFYPPPLFFLGGVGS